MAILKMTYSWSYFKKKKIIEITDKKILYWYFHINKLILYHQKMIIQHFLKCRLHVKIILVKLTFNRVGWAGFDRMNDVNQPLFFSCYIMFLTQFLKSSGSAQFQQSSSTTSFSIIFVKILYKNWHQLSYFTWA